MDLNIVWTWVQLNAKPLWEEVRGGSPAVKACYQQFESLIMINNILYRLEQTSGRDVENQLRLPRTLKEEFLDLIHSGVAGHLGSFKTRAHVGRRAYWFWRRQDVDIYCQKCVCCNEYHKGRVTPKQGHLRPMVLGAPVKR